MGKSERLCSLWVGLDLDMDFFMSTSIDSPFSLALLVVLGVATGTVAGILGIGGGLLIVPMLTLWPVALVQATATSLLGVMVSAISGSWRNRQQGELNVRRSMVLGLFGLPTAQVGAWLANQVSDRVLAFSFAAFLVGMIGLVAWKKRIQQSPPSSQNGAQGIPLIGLLAGFLSGLFGVGGGAVMVPLQMVVLGEPIKSAVRTSLGAIALVAISGLVRYGIQGNVLWLPGFALAIGGMVGAQMGTRALRQISSDRVNQAFRALLVVLALYMCWRGIRGR